MPPALIERTLLFMQCHFSLCYVVINILYHQIMAFFLVSANVEILFGNFSDMISSRHSGEKETISLLKRETIYVCPKLKTVIFTIGHGYRGSEIVPTFGWINIYAKLNHGWYFSLPHEWLTSFHLLPSLLLDSFFFLFLLLLVTNSFRLSGSHK